MKWTELQSCVAPVVGSGRAQGEPAQGTAVTAQLCETPPGKAGGGRREACRNDPCWKMALSLFVLGSLVSGRGWGVRFSSKEMISGKASGVARSGPCW